MGERLYVLRFKHLSQQKMYYTTHVKDRTLLIASPSKTEMGLLRDTVLHHHDTTRTWINRGVFYRGGEDTLHITDHANFDKRARALDFLLNTPTHEPLLDLEFFSLSDPRDMDEVRRMFYFANTSLFIMDDYEYAPRTSHLSLHGFMIELPADHRDEPQSDHIEFLNALLSL